MARQRSNQLRPAHPAKGCLELSLLPTQGQGSEAEAWSSPQEGIRQSDLADGLFLASHLWRLEGGGSALLGTACEGNEFMVVVRFTQDAIQPVRVP